ncbi:MAG TPA: CsbD family protein [Burkholderiales bacterium]|nr:CsbD family protein [Burkholderiales bacterium]
MNRDRLEGKWKQLSGRVKEQWGWLTQDRLSVVAGQHDQIAGRYQEQYGITREEGARQLREFRRRNRDWSSSSR